MSSILTNNSAMVALQTLKNIDASPSKIQADIATGKAVANAKENAAVCAIPDVMETDRSAVKTIRSNPNQADATMGTARDGAGDVTTLLTQAKALAVGGTVSTADYARIDTDIMDKVKRISAIIRGTQMNGVNLLSAGGQIGVVGSLTRTNGTAETTANVITVASVDLEAGRGLDLATGALADYGAPTVADKATATAAITVNGAATLGSAAKRMTDQAKFLGQLSDPLTSGIGSLVDAEMANASARPEARQQVGIQALSMANQGPSAVMSPFR